MSFTPTARHCAKQIVSKSTSLGLKRDHWSNSSLNFLFFFYLFFFLNTKYFNTHGERESPNFLDCEGFFFFLLLIRKKERERNKTTREAHQFPKPLLQEQENEKVSKTLTLN